jgi:hypothetical protein
MSCLIYRYTNEHGGRMVSSPVTYLGNPEFKWLAIITEIVMWSSSVPPFQWLQRKVFHCFEPYKYYSNPTSKHKCTVSVLRNLFLFIKHLPSAHESNIVMGRAYSSKGENDKWNQHSGGHLKNWRGDVCIILRYILHSYLTVMLILRLWNK